MSILPNSARPGKYPRFEWPENLRGDVYYEYEDPPAIEQCEEIPVPDGTQDTGHNALEGVSPCVPESCVSVSSESSPSEFVKSVWESAKSRPAPAVASRYYVPGIKLLVMLCAELQVAAGDGTFYLSCRDAAALIAKPQDFRTVSKWLNKLEADGVLRRVNTGSQATHKANEYRFLGGQ
jgi:hypothetical protein